MVSRMRILPEWRSACRIHAQIIFPSVGEFWYIRARPDWVVQKHFSLQFHCGMLSFTRIIRYS